MMNVKVECVIVIVAHDAFEKLKLEGEEAQMISQF